MKKKCIKCSAKKHISDLNDVQATRHSFNVRSSANFARDLPQSESVRLLAWRSWTRLKPLGWSDYKAYQAVMLLVNKQKWDKFTR